MDFDTAPFQPEAGFCGRGVAGAIRDDISTPGPDHQTRAAGGAHRRVTRSPRWRALKHDAAGGRSFGGTTTRPAAWHRDDFPHHQPGLRARAVQAHRAAALRLMVHRGLVGASRAQTTDRRGGGQRAWEGRRGSLGASAHVRRPRIATPSAKPAGTTGRRRCGRPAVELRTDYRARFPVRRGWAAPRLTW